ncbi:hypothetical protein [Pseudomonas sp. SBB6]|uniref:InvB/SpaK family type III secretion system chaperone n=1 Tax=Pseudomonas sp. SBB6 TaxID=2962032 RepID=UPI0020B8D8B6|nr:hypothetical protein [Pseudomonas sp. SBB6]MCP3749308.1 hypothetical protein [Pseudomonas sp. SBB6]
MATVDNLLRGTLRQHHHGDTRLERLLDDLPDISISEQAGDIWFSAAAVPLTPALLRCHADPILQLLMRPSAFARNQQLQLFGQGDSLELRMLLADQAHSSVQGFAMALDEFFGVLLQLRALVLR